MQRCKNSILFALSNASLNRLSRTRNTTLVLTEIVLVLKRLQQPRYDMSHFWSELTTGTHRLRC